MKTQLLNQHWPDVLTNNAPNKLSIYVFMLIIASNLNKSVKKY